MKKKLLGENIERKCQYCAFGTPVKSSDKILCPKKGVTDKYASCKKYIYDPLKRIPQNVPGMIQFSESDFSLEENTDES